MIIQSFGIQDLRKNRHFPDHLENLDTLQTLSPPTDGYASSESENAHGDKGTEISRDLNTKEKEEAPSFFRSFATKAALTLVGLALLPSILNMGGIAKADAIEPGTETSREQVIQNTREEEETEGIEEMRAHEIFGEVRKTVEDLKRFDDSPEQVLVEQGGILVSAGKVDNLAGRGEIGVGSPQRVSKERSVSGTLSYDAVTGRPRTLSAEVIEQREGSQGKKIVEYSEGEGSRSFKVSSGGTTLEVRINRGASINDSLRGISGRDIMKEIERTAEDLKKYDDSPEQVLVEQGGMWVSAGQVDNVAGKGEVGVGSPQVVTRTRSVSGTLSYNPETGEPRTLHAEVMERIAGRKVTKTVEYNESEVSRSYRVSTGNESFEVKIENRNS